MTTTATASGLTVNLRFRAAIHAFLRCVVLLSAIMVTSESSAAELSAPVLTSPTSWTTNEPFFTGTGTPGSVVNITLNEAYRNELRLDFTTVVGADGTWTIDPSDTSSIPNGVYFGNLWAEKDGERATGDDFSLGVEIGPTTSPSSSPKSATSMLPSGSNPVPTHSPTSPVDPLIQEIAGKGARLVYPDASEAELASIESAIAADLSGVLQQGTMEQANDGESSPSIRILPTTPSYFCPLHRDNTSTEAGTCHCGRALHQATLGSVHLGQPFHVELTVAGSVSEHTMPVTLSTPSGQQRNVPLIPIASNPATGTTTYRTPREVSIGGKRGGYEYPGTIGGLTLENGVPVTFTLNPPYSGLNDAAPSQASVGVYDTPLLHGIGVNQNSMHVISDHLVRQSQAIRVIKQDPVSADSDVTATLDQWQFDLNTKLWWLAETRRMVFEADTPKGELIIGNGMLESLTGELNAMGALGQPMRIPGTGDPRPYFIDRTTSLINQAADVIPDNQIEVGTAAAYGTYSLLTQLTLTGSAYTAFNPYNTNEWGQDVTDDEQVVAGVQLYGGIVTVFGLPKVVDALANGGFEIRIPSGSPVGRALPSSPAWSLRGVPGARSVANPQQQAIFEYSGQAAGRLRPSGMTDAEMVNLQENIFGALIRPRSVGSDAAVPGSGGGSGGSSGPTRALPSPESAPPSSFEPVGVLPEAPPPGVRAGGARNQPVPSEGTGGVGASKSRAGRETQVLAGVGPIRRPGETGVATRMNTGRAPERGGTGLGDDYVPATDEIILFKAQQEMMFGEPWTPWTGAQRQRLQVLVNEPAAFRYDRWRGPLDEDEVVLLGQVAARHRGPGETQTGQPAASPQRVRGDTERVAVPFGRSPAQPQPANSVPQEPVPPATNINTRGVRRAPAGPPGQAAPPASGDSPGVSGIGGGTLGLGAAPDLPSDFDFSEFYQSINANPTVAQAGRDFVFQLEVVVSNESNPEGSDARLGSRSEPMMRRAGAAAKGLLRAVASAFRPMSSFRRSGLSPAYLGAFSRRTSGIGEQARRSSTPATSFAVLRSLGGSTGEVFELAFYGSGRASIELAIAGLVVEPLDQATQARLQKELSAYRNQRPQKIKLDGYCLERLREPPSQDMFFRVADSKLQGKYEPIRRILDASRRLERADALMPDSDPTEYFHSARQWSIWAKEGNFDQRSFAKAFLEHTEKNFKAAEQRWTDEIEQLVSKLVPNRWQDIQRILTEANLSR